MGGTALLVVVDTRVATDVLAAVTLAYVALAVIRPTFALPVRLERRLALPAGMLNGVLTGLTGSQILPLIPYMMALRLEPHAQVIAINLAVTIASGVLGVTLLASGGMTGDLLLLSCIGSVPAIGGALLGNAVRDLLPVEALRRITLVVLVAIAVSLGGRSAFDAALGSMCGGVVVAGSSGAFADEAIVLCEALTGKLPVSVPLAGEVLKTQ